MTPEELKEAVERQFGAKASLSYIAPVRHMFDNTIWEGPVHVFDLEGHPTVRHAYAWSAAAGTMLDAIIVPHGDGILGPAHAVRVELMKAVKVPRS